ncbi:MAG: 1-acyl-sn-glycerol-3-phosphate acyltransferase, partial [Clostridium sp.]|nr:1-acyl-sn-glycerol-3-phosphate acyltransferase [Clostridium sp.]
MKGILCIAWQIVSFLLFRTRQMRRLEELEKTEPVKAQEEAIAEVRRMFHCCLKGCKVNVTVKGLENIPKDTPVLYVGNHRGFFDCVVGYTTVPGRVGFVAKKELMKYPFLPNWMLLLNCLFMDRKDMKQSLKT